MSGAGHAAQTERRRAGSDVPRLALSLAEAAKALGCSDDFLREHILCELRVVRRGRRRLIPVKAIEEWLDDQATRTLEDRT